MKLLTGSKASWPEKENIEPMLGCQLHLFHDNMPFADNDVMVGWGQMANTYQMGGKRRHWSPPYWQLEDGFIGYIGHPAKGGKAVSPYRRSCRYLLRCPPTQPKAEQLIATPCDRRHAGARKPSGLVP